MTRSTPRALPFRFPPFQVDGLASFSHVWVLFVFHQNTNATTVALGRSVKAKVTARTHARAHASDIRARNAPRDASDHTRTHALHARSK
jgi:hypothetical protein